MSLFTPFHLGHLELANRLVMAPMTRSRALPGAIPSPLAIDYYTQRASAGLIITEGSQVSPMGQGYIRTPGIYSDAQVQAWRAITDSVHAAGGRIFLQLWHVGRVSHPAFHGGNLPIAPSALGFEGEVFTPEGKKATVLPRALEIGEIPGVVAEFRQAAVNARDAGFDGVEIHGANGYLLDQFLRDGSNVRTDEYGGSLENRARFPLEVTDAVTEVWGAKKVGYRVSPYNPFNGMHDSNPVATFSYLARELGRRKLGYLHNLEPIAGSMMAPAGTIRVSPFLRKEFGGAYIVNGGYGRATGDQAIASGEADLVAFGVPYLANPDLTVRFKQGAPLNVPDPATFYAGDARGYADYPSLS